MAKRKTRLLIDGDHIVYATAVAVEKTVHWDNGISTVWADRDAATENIEAYVERLREKFNADEVLFAVSNSKQSFRDRIYADYKRDRATVRRPIILGWLREWCVENLDGKAIDDLEADDVIGISATHPRWKKWRQIIVSEDKDLKTIPGEIYSPKKDMLFKVSEEEAERNFYIQALTGDTVDGYPGCPGVGPVNAEERLEKLLGVQPYEHTFKRGKRAGQTETRYEDVEMETPWEVILSLYAKAGVSEEDALTQARLARILRYENYDFDTGTVVHWTPSSAASA